MGAKKKIALFILLLLALGAAVLVAYRYYLLNKTSHLASFIPADAQVVVYLNTRIGGVKLKQNKDFKFDQPLWKKSDYVKHVKSVFDLGIDLSSDLAYVEYRQVQYLVCMLQDADQFSEQIKASQAALYSPETSFGEYRTVSSLKDSFQLIWNNKLLYLIRRSKLSTEEIISRIEVKETNNFALTETYKDIANANELLWFYIGKSPIKNWPYHQLKGVLRLDSGLHIQASQNLKQEISPKPNALANPDSLALFYCGRGHVLSRIIRDLSILHIGDADDAVLSLDFNAIEKLLVLGGRRIREKKFLAYAYDDDFNKIEREYVKRDTVKSSALYYRYPSDSNWMKMYNSTDLFPFAEELFKQPFTTYVQFNQTILSEYLPLRFRSLPFNVLYTETSKNNKMTVHFDLQCRNWMNLLKQFSE